MERNYIECGKPLPARRNKSQMFCVDACRIAEMTRIETETRLSVIKHKCTICQAAVPLRLRDKRYCSENCRIRATGANRVSGSCTICGGALKGPRVGTPYCGMTCADKGLKTNAIR